MQAMRTWCNKIDKQAEWAMSDINVAGVDIILIIRSTNIGLGPDSQDLSNQVRFDSKLYKLIAY